MTPGLLDTLYKSCDHNEAGAYTVVISKLELNFICMHIIVTVKIYLLATYLLGRGYCSGGISSMHRKEALLWAKLGVREVGWFLQVSSLILEQQEQNAQLIGTDLLGQQSSPLLLYVAL